MAENNKDKNKELVENGGQSTDSNLPILFANGYPTSLDKMSVNQLELFIPFLLRCSSTVEGMDPLVRPGWWPSTIPFKIPLEKPKEFQKDWHKALKEVVRGCYDFHKLPYLLKYSEDLCKNDKANLRYVKASESTMSLFSREPSKLLLTFRNENMNYDAKKKMKLWKKHEETPDDCDDDEESTFVTMICDYCDAVFYSDEAYTKHEEKCAEKEENEAQIVIADNIVISDDDEEDANDEDDAVGDQTDFMAYFFLKSAATDEIPRRNNSMIERSLSPKKKKKPAHRTRHVTNKKEKDLERLIPFSSPAGIVLTKKNIVGEKYISETQELIDEYTGANVNTKIPARSKSRFTVTSDNAVFKEMRQPRHYSWPKRTLRSATREANFEFLNRPLIDQMSPCSVTLQRLSVESIQKYLKDLKQKREMKQLEILAREAAECVDLCSDSGDDDEKDYELERSFEYSGDFFGQMYQSYDQLPDQPATPMFSMDIPTLPRHIFHQSFDQASTSVPGFSMDISTTQSHSLMFQHSESSSSTRQIFQQVHFNPTSNIISNKKRQRESDESNEVHSEKRSTSIQSWIQTVNGENFGQNKNVVNTN